MDNNSLNERINSHTKTLLKSKYKNTLCENEPLHALCYSLPLIKYLQSVGCWQDYVHHIPRFIQLPPKHTALSAS